MTIPRIAITPGEPAGIGPDLCTALGPGIPEAELVLVADADLIRARTAALGGKPELPELDLAAPPRPNRVSILHRPLAAPTRAGRLDPTNAAYVLDTLRRACDGCLHGDFAALVTGPVHKGVINEAGQPFTGHTEFLAERSGGHPVMMLATPGLRVALATTHHPLADIPKLITVELLEQVIGILHRDLVNRFGIADPRILVCGLNPHAGEGGHLGREELEIIEPTLERLRAAGMTLEGPLPADTLFTPRNLERADAVLAMYHDQGLPVLKHMGFGHAVNITLGLPIVRTSVDHGTALDLAGSGKADSGSLFYAIETALEMTGN